MNASVAIQVLPTVTDDEEVIRIVDAVIDYIKSTGLSYYVGPCETSIEGDYDTVDGDREELPAGCREGRLSGYAYLCEDLLQTGRGSADHRQKSDQTSSGINTKKSPGISVKALTNAVNRTYNCTCVNGYDEDSRNHWKCAANRGGCEPGESTGISEDRLPSLGLKRSFFYII